jgi:hypothetical protein
MSGSAIPRRVVEAAVRDWIRVDADQPRDAQGKRNDE